MDEEEVEFGIQTVSPMITNDTNVSNNNDSDSLEDMMEERQSLQDNQGITLMGFNDNINNNNNNNVNNNRYNSIPQLKPQSIKKEKEEESSKGGFFSNLFSFGGNSRSINSNNNRNNNNRKRSNSLERQYDNNTNDDGWNWSGNTNNQNMSESMVQKNVSSITSMLNNKNRRVKKNNNKNRKKRLVKKKINTNVVALDLATLDDKANIATGEAYVCSNNSCKAILSQTDDLLDTDGDFKCDDNEKIWICSFCGTRNVIDIEEEEKPNSETMDYIISPPSDEKSEEENLIVFCLDTSGSMCVTQAVEGKFELKGKEDLSNISAFNEDRSNQWLPNQKKNTTYVSRLQAVQASIDDQLTNLAKTKPKCKVALVTFSNEVTIIGDGTQTSEFIAGDKLSNENLLKEIGSSYKIKESIEKSKEKLVDKLYKLRENGQTALGPALVVSIALASQKAGSQVILCTDGLANIGLGKLDELTEEEEETTAEWYENLGTRALNSGVTVSVISITDSETRLENLGKVCDTSQGTVERINPLELKSNFKGILNKKIIATKCQATMIIHPVLKFKSDESDEIDLNNLIEENENNSIKPLQRKQLSMVKEESIIIEKDKNDKNKKEENDKSDKNKEDNKDKKEDKKDDKTKEENKDDKEDKEKKEENKNKESTPPIVVDRQVQDIGNVFDDSKIYFEYTVNKLLLRRKYKDLKDFIFQVQITFDRNDGSKMMRCITQKKPITTDKKELLKNINMGIMAANASRKTGRLIEDGDYESARANIYMNSVWMSNNIQNKSHMSAVNNYMLSNLNVDSVVQQQQQIERSSNQKKSLLKMSKSKRKKARSQQRNDKFSKAMYYSKKM